MPARRALLLTIALVSIGVAITYRRVVRFRQLRWGATDEEAVERMPGDDLLRHADLAATRAITIDANRETVWSWLSQIGQGRAGFYSYDWLENLVGCDIHSADEIRSEWQHLGIGDEIRLHPDVALEVALVEPPSSLVLRSPSSIDGQQALYDFTWSFVLREHTDGSRLIVRERYQYHQPSAAFIIEPVSVASFVMTRKMLHGIRDRAATGSRRRLNRLGFDGGAIC